MNTSETNLNPWLQFVGFSFNPFSLIEASKDPHLLKYLVSQPKAYNITSGEWHSFVFAPAGGGKTALRASVIKPFWKTVPDRAFPIPYTPPFFEFRTLTPTTENHLQIIVHQCAEMLLLTLTHFPHWFLDKPQDTQKEIASTLISALPGPLTTYISPCLESQSTLPLSDRFTATFLPDELGNNRDNLEVLIQLSTYQSENPQTNPHEFWKKLTDLLLNVFKVPSIYILLDGLDSIYDTYNNPEIAIESIAPLFEMMDQWAENYTFLKSFIPTDTKKYLKSNHPKTFKKSKSITIKWDPESLIELLDKRVEVASNGDYTKFIQLIENPDLAQLTDKIAPLPREILVLVQLIIKAQAENLNPQTYKLTEQSVEQALIWYYKQIPNEVVLGIPKKYREGR